MVDGREVEEKEEQDSAYQDWLCYFHASHFQQVSDLYMFICYIIICYDALSLSIGFVVFVRFEYSNSYMWLEFHNAPLDKDISLITDVSKLPLNLAFFIYSVSATAKISCRQSVRGIFLDDLVVTTP